MDEFNQKNLKMRRFYAARTYIRGPWTAASKKANRGRPPNEKTDQGVLTVTTHTKAKQKPKKQKKKSAQLACA